MARLPDGLFDALRRLYAGAEGLLLAGLRRAVARWVATPDADGAARRRLVRDAYQVVAALDRESRTVVAALVAEAHARGQADADRDTGQVDPLDVLRVALAADRAADQARPDHLSVVRTVDDAYRRITADAAARVVTGELTRRVAAQRALDEFAARGITGFVDRSGRRWELASYAEMAVRTIAMNAMVDAQTQRLSAAGFDLVIVSDSPRECPLCRDHENTVKSITGTTPGYPTLAAARAAGLFHPGCTHSVARYQPGVTRRATGPGAGANPEGYDDKQRLRALERQVRASKRLGLVALDETARRRARVRTRQWQAAIRAHVDATGAKRIPAREQISRAR